LTVDSFLKIKMVMKKEDALEIDYYLSHILDI
jgi:hypothetical protein